MAVKPQKVPLKIKTGLATLLKKGIDALWVVNDNGLLNQNSLIKGWIPSIKKANIPVIVGVKRLISTKFNFGSFAIVPDHNALGAQGANLIAEIMASHWLIGDRKIEQPLSVEKMVNLDIFAKKGIKVRRDELNRLDKIIGKY